MKSLIISSNVNNLNNSSGEVDSLIIRLGLSFRGYEVFASENENYDESGGWDYIFYFGNDFHNLLKLNQFCIRTKILIFPFFNLNSSDGDGLLLKRYKELELRHANSSIIMREHRKLKLLRDYDIKNHLLKYSWFLPPMAIRDSYELNEKLNANICIFTDQLECDSILKFINSIDVKVENFFLYSKNIELKNALANHKLHCFNKVNYGSAHWYQTIVNSVGLFEPSNRVTASSLEFLYCGKNIYIESPDEFIKAIPDIICTKLKNYYILNISDKSHLSKYLAYNFMN